jgi:hypothetical protein
VPCGLRRCTERSLEAGDLEDDSCCNLHLPAVDLRRGNRSKGGAIERSVRQRKDWVIGDIEDLPSKLGSDPRAHGNRLHQRHVEVYDTGGLLDLKDDAKYLFIGLLSFWITATAVLDIRNDNRLMTTVFC